MSMQEGDWKGAEARWVRGLTVSPGHGYLHGGYGGLLLFTGRIEEARVHILRALDLDPKEHRTSAGMLYLVERNYQAAIEQFEQAPAQPRTLFVLAYTHHLAGDDADAAEVFLKPLPAELAAALRSAFEQGGYPGMIRAVLEFRIQESGKPCTNAPGDAAVFLAIIGEAERMFECLGETVPSMNYEMILVINGYPAFDRYRDDPRFIATLNRILPER
jgi:tetratricopeptide (TPR) repeat protein